MCVLVFVVYFVYPGAVWDYLDAYTVTQEFLAWMIVTPMAIVTTAVWKPSIHRRNMQTDFVDYMER